MQNQWIITDYSIFFTDSRNAVQTCLSALCGVFLKSYRVVRHVAEQRPVNVTLQARHRVPSRKWWRLTSAMSCACLDINVREDKKEKEKKKKKKTAAGPSCGFSKTAIHRPNGTRCLLHFEQTSFCDSEQNTSGTKYSIQRAVARHVPLCFYITYCAPLCRLPRSLRFACHVRCTGSDADSDAATEHCSFG